jgi:hypothetical protein
MRLAIGPSVSCFFHNDWRPIVGPYRIMKTRVGPPVWDPDGPGQALGSV